MHFNSAGIYFEQDDPILVAVWREQSALAAAVRSAIERFSFCERNLRDAKKSDWPAYKHSRCRSIREFESLYLPINILAVNEAELFYDAWALPKGEDAISSHITLNRYAPDEEFGRQIIRLFECSTCWPAQFAI